MKLAVVGGILLAGDESLWVEESAVCASADLVDDIGLEVYVERAGNILAGAAAGLMSESMVRLG